MSIHVNVKQEMETYIIMNPDMLGKLTLDANTAKYRICHYFFYHDTLPDFPFILSVMSIYEYSLIILFSILYAIHGFWKEGIQLVLYSFPGDKICLVVNSEVRKMTI